MAKVYELITSRIMQKLEEGVVPWHKPWRSGEEPRNLVSNKLYRGINVFTLGSAGYESPYWVTFRQARDRGGTIKRGQHGWPVVYWRWDKPEVKPGAPTEPERPSPKNAHDPNPRRRPKGYPLYFTVFNVQQTEGVPYPELKAREAFNAIEACDQVVRGMPSAPAIDNSYSKAFYRPAHDLVGMPRPESFNRPEDYYSTLFHELTHATGHVSRLNRPGIMTSPEFASNDYSKEELVAEMGAAFLSGHCGIENKILDSSAAYIDNWLGNLQKDKRLVVIAAAQAQRAADYILNLKSDPHDTDAGDEQPELRAPVVTYEAEGAD